MNDPIDGQLSDPPKASPLKPTRAKPQVGVPLWLPLAALLIALAFAVFIAVRIGPTLSALISPPDPVLPTDSVLQSHDSKSTEDNWFYKTKTSGCDVAFLYQKAFGQCIFDPASGCSGPTNEQPVPGLPYQIAECSGRQSIAQYGIAWRVFITANGDADGQTLFRVYREVN